jgi:hypothetical protein
MRVLLYVVAVNPPAGSLCCIAAASLMQALEVLPRMSLYAVVVNMPAASLCFMICKPATLPLQTTRSC